MIATLLNVLIILLGTVIGMIATLPIMIGIFDHKNHYIPFGIGTAFGVIAAVILAYVLQFHS